MMTKLLLLAFPMTMGLLVLTFLIDAQSCGSKSSGTNKGSPSVTDKLANGVWGGQHIHFDVTDNGASIEFDCAHGAIKQPIVLDAAGKFDVPGSYTAEHGGPVRRYEESTERAVRYTGSVQGEQMSLAISDAKTDESIAKFTLTRGKEG